MVEVDPARRPDIDSVIGDRFFSNGMGYLHILEEAKISNESDISLSNPNNQDNDHYASYIPASKFFVVF